MYVVADYLFYFTFNRILSICATFYLIRMSHWRRRTTKGAEFWISCKRPAFLSSFSRLQVIQNKRPWCSAAAYVTAGCKDIQEKIAISDPPTPIHSGYLFHLDWHSFGWEHY